MGKKNRIKEKCIEQSENKLKYMRIKQKNIRMMVAPLDKNSLSAFYIRLGHYYTNDMDVYGYIFIQIYL